MLRTGYRGESLIAVDTGWRVEGKVERQQTWFYDDQVVVVFTGYEVKSFAPLSHLPLTPVRGQITILPASPYSRKSADDCICQWISCSIRRRTARAGSDA